MGRYWAYFWLTAVIWGSSFMFIRIGVAEVNPLHLVFMRLGIAAVGLWAVVLLTRQKLPKDLGTWGAMILNGFGNNFMPFLLITWGEKSVESGLASVLQATAALFGLIVAHYAFADERITPKKVVGIALGFIGIVVLSARNWQDGTLESSSLMGQMAIILASLFYGIFSAYSRKIMAGRDLAPVTVSAGTMLGGALCTLVAIGIGTAFFDLPATMPAYITPEAFGAIIILGLLNTFVAYLLFYSVIKHLGSARATMVTYVVPVIGLLLGVVILGEQLDAYILIGAALIFSGIAIVNLKVFNRINVWFSRPRIAPAGD